MFEVGLYKPAQQGCLAAEPEMLPRVWDSTTLLKSAGWLRYQNRLGRNIYIRPRGAHPLSLVDDLTAGGLERMKKGGFDPCLVVETSPGNFQAWLDHGQVLAKNESTAAARALAERFGGDKGAADWRHFGRLAGFTNRKEKYRTSADLFPFVRLIEASPGQVYPQATEFHTEVRRTLARKPARVPAPAQISARGRLLTIDDFRAKPEYGGDGNRIDLAYTIYALSHGVSDAAVWGAIASRDLSKKGSDARQADYIERTIKKAHSTLSETSRLSPPPLVSGLSR